MQPNTQLVTDDNLPEDERAFMSKIPYMNMVGSLRYIADCTRPDIAFITSQLAKHLKSPSMLHYNALVHCMQYLKGTKDKWLLFGHGNHDNITGYTDVDGMMQENNKAISGYTFFLGESLISWSSKGQKLVSLSTYEAELIALSNGIQEAIALRYLAEEILQISDAPTNIYCDNQAVIKSIEADETKYSTRTKHIGLRRNFIKCYVEEQLINIKYVQTDEQRADILTKSLHVPKIKHLTDLISLVNV